MAATCKVLIVLSFIVIKGDERGVYGVFSHSLTVQFKVSAVPSRYTCLLVRRNVMFNKSRQELDM
jgi:hypothetical protein